MVEQLCKPKVYQIKPVSGVDTEWIVNCRQLQDLQKAYDDSDNNSDVEMGNIPSYNPKVKLKETPHTHQYVNGAKSQPTTLFQSTTGGIGTDHSDGLCSHTQIIDHCAANVIIESTSL